jgi:putative membrane protein
VTVEGRLHPLAIAVYGWRGVRLVGLVGLVSLITARSPLTVALLAAAGLVVVTPAAVLAWARFSYRVGNGVLEVRSGVLTRRTRTIPLDRVRGVDVTVPPLHRVAGLVQARVEDAGGGAGASGLTLAAISRRDADALRDAVLRAHRPSATAEAAGGDPIARVRARTLALAGASSGRYLLVPVAAVAGLLNVAGEDRLPWVRDGVDAALAAAPTDALGVALLLAAGLAGAAVVAALGSVLVDGAFTLRDHEGRLTAERGLLARRSVSIVRDRVHALEIRDTPAWRLLRLAELRAVVGGVATDERAARGRTTLLPAGRPAAVWGLARRLDPGLDPGLDPHPARGRRRRLTRACAAPVAGALAAAATGATGPALTLAGAAVLMVPVALDRHRSLGNHLRGGRLGLREGSLSRRHAVIDPSAIVAYRVRRSPGQRRAGLCTLTVFLGQGAGSRRALDIDEADAADLLARLEPALMAPFVARGPVPRE